MVIVMSSTAASEGSGNVYTASMGVLLGIGELLRHGHARDRPGHVGLHVGVRERAQRARFAVLARDGELAGTGPGGGQGRVGLRGA
jgi:hypothetical protein